MLNHHLPEKTAHFEGEDYVAQQMAFVESLGSGNMNSEITGYHCNGAANPPYAEVFYREQATEH